MPTFGRQSKMDGDDVLAEATASEAKCDAVRSAQGQTESTRSSDFLCILLVDSTSEITGANQAAAAFFGYSVREIVGLGVRAVVPHWDQRLPHRSAAVDEMRIAANGCHDDGRLIVVRRKDGVEIPVEVAVESIVGDAAGNRAIWFRGLGDHRDLMWELRQRNSILSAQHELMPDGMLVVDEHSRILSFNERFLEIWGIPRDLLATRADDPVLQAVVAQVEFPEAFVARVRELYADKSRRARDEIRTRSGRTLERHTAPMVGPDGEYFGRAWYFRDVTESRELQSSLLSTNRALQAVNSLLQAVGRGESEKELLSLACSLLMKQGAYPLVWIGYSDGENRALRKVADAQRKGINAAAASRWLESEYAQGTAALAARLGSAHLVRDLSSDPRMRPSRNDAIKSGLSSSVTLPLKSDSGAFGVLAIYSDAPGGIVPEEVKVLKQLAAALSFGIVTHRSNIERMRAIAHTERLLHFDSATGLPNRAQLHEFLGEFFSDPTHAGKSLALLCIGVDRLWDIQHAIGTASTDEVFKSVATRIRGFMGDGKFVARVESDEFALVLPEIELRGVQDLVGEIQRRLDEPIEHDGTLIDVHLRCGVAFAPNDAIDPDKLVRRAKCALGRARARVTDCEFFSADLDSDGSSKIAMLAKLRRAARNGELRLLYQPKIDARRGSVCGVEALVRWLHPNDGMVPPGEFIPLAEQTGLIRQITSWVLDTAMDQIEEWVSRGLDVPVAVNVSPYNLRDPGFLDQIVSLKARAGSNMRLLQVEVTETALMDDPARSLQTLTTLQDMGVRIYIDDFGSGFSSLHYIATLPIDGLKLDQSLTRGMLADAKRRAVVSAAVTLAHDLSLRVVAEGIETDRQAETSRRLGCDELQGFRYGAAMPPEALFNYCIDARRST